MNKQTLLIIGLVGGIVAAVGVVLPWISVSAGPFTVTASGMDWNQGKVILLGGILALVGGIVALAVKTAPSAVGYLIPIGGILAIAGWGWAVADAGTLSGFAYGFYACLVGGILALIGTLGVISKK